MHYAVKRLLAGTALTAVMAGYSSSASAQQSPQEGAVVAPTEAGAVNAIVVTGSRIARRDYVAQSPIVTTSKEQIENSGTPTIDAALLQLPQFQPGSGGYTNRSGGGLGVGQANLNLRGLGSVRTLVLVDGRRAQPGNGQNVIDVNTIPSSAIASVEIITGGASATYGSDAIAGVVNFKLRTGFDGLEVSGQAGISDRGDADNRQLSFVAGRSFASGRATVMIAGEYADRSAVGYRDRDFSTPTHSLSNSLPNGSLIAAAMNLPTQAAVNTVFARYGFAAGTVPRTVNFGVNPNGSLFRSSQPGTNYIPYGEECAVNDGEVFGYDAFCTNQLQGKLERYASLVRAEYEVSPGLTLFAQGNYAHAIAAGQGSHTNLALQGRSGLLVPVSNPFIPADLRELLASRPDPSAPFDYLVRFTANGPRRHVNTTDTFQILTGGRGELLDPAWTYELYYTHGETSADDRAVGASSESAVMQLINDPLGGATHCQGGFNVFGPNKVSDACAEYVRYRTLSKTKIEQDELAANIAGTLFSLPAGEVQLAISGAHRINHFDVNPDPALQTGDIAGTQAIPPTVGATKVTEGAVELLIPILRDIPFVQSLNISPAYRYSHYDPTGGVSSYKLSFDWRLTDGLLLRGGYQRAVRAPNIGELFLAPGRSSANIGTPPSGGDPCDARSSLRAGPNAAKVRELCLAQGVPAAVIDTYNQSSGGVGPLTGGNENLSPETAKTFTIGGVLQPHWLGAAFESFSLSLDYYDIEITDVISTLGVRTGLSKCFNTDGSNPTYDVNNIYCEGIVRNPNSGGIQDLKQALLNLGAYRTSGVDVQIDWRLPLDTIGLGRQSGAVSLSTVINYVDRFDIQALPGDPFQSFLGTIQNSTSAGGVPESYPRWKWTATATYELGPAQLGVRWRHLPAFADVSTVTDADSTTPGTPVYNYFDLLGRYRLTEKIELRAGVTNVGDRQPPDVGGLRGITNLGTYDPIGRSYYLGARARF
jgi:outer membrane receptor protein involved in Fe transport